MGGNDGGGVPGYGLPLGQAQQLQLQFMKDQLRQELQQRSFLSHAQVQLPASLCTVNILPANISWLEPSHSIITTVSHL